MTDRQRLTSQVTLRLDEDLAKGLRELADERGLKYTSLLREWIEEMYEVEISPTSTWVQIEEGGESGGKEGRNLRQDVDTFAPAS